MDKWRGRCLVLLASALWSTSGAFVKNLDLSDIAITVYRALSAGAILCVIGLAARMRPTWHPAMPPMVVCFGAMSFLFIASMTRTTAANAILLQYTAPFWMFLASVAWLREPFDRKSFLALLGGMVGIGVLLVGQWHSAPTQQTGIVFGLASGVMYAGVAVSLRVLRAHDAIWLACINHLGSGLLLWGMVEWTWSTHPLWPPPDGRSLTILAIFGAAQMALPYVLFARGLRSITPQEAGVLTLIEPMLNPLWTYLFAGEVPSLSTAIGGAILVLSLSLRYLPGRRKVA